VKARVALSSIIAAVFILGTTGHAYKAMGQKWRNGTITMQLQLGSPSTTLIDGSSDWNAVADGALAMWNQYLTGVQFASTRGSSAVSDGNGVNTISFGDSVYGEPFGNGVLAITETLYRPSDQTITEADVIFNTKFSWNSYRGNVRSGLVDLRRVALHEFGHVLGLDHPDDYGQNVVAVMNSHVSNVDTLQADDIDGVQSIYGGGTTTSTPAPTPVVPHDTLTMSGRLLPGQSITSGNNQFRLLYQTDGNLVLYDDVKRTWVWSSGTAGTSAGVAVLQTDGNFVVYNAAGAPQWWTSTFGTDRLVVQSDGNLVVYNGSGQPLWDRLSASQ
jgi:hypothetical protein